MTRETKIGLIVATSFLGLVGVVVAARLSRNEEKLAAEQAAVPARINPVKKDSKSSDRDPKSMPESGKEPNPLILASKNTEPRIDPTLPVDLNNVKEPRLQQPAISAPSLLDDEHQKKLRELEEQKKKLEGLTPAPTLDQKPVEPPPLRMAANDKTSSTPSAPLSASPPPLAEPPSGKPEPLPPPSTPPSTPFPPPAASSPPPIKITDAPAPGLATPVPAQLAANSGGNPPPVGIDQKPSIPPAATPSPMPPPATPPPATPPPATPPGTTPPSAAPVPPPLTNEPPIPPPGSPPGVAPVNIGATKPGTPSPTPEPKSLDPVPPIGARPTSSSPPITINPDPSKGPQVNSYDVERYVTKADDTSFARISQTIYGSDKYAKALAVFNKDHPFASEALKQEPARLQAGQAVFFPPVHVLESKYPWAIGDAAPPAGNPGTRPITIGGTEPLVPSVGNPNTMSGPPPGTRPTQTAAVNPDNTRNYTVREGGEHILEIARTVLRSSSRWIEVYRLNPNVRPEYPIPAGTVLRLPAS